jgi:hypothetical protein
MPITLNHSNISVQYSSDKSYIIETVKSDLYRRNDNYDTIVRNNLQIAPVTPTTYVDNSGNIYAVESYTYSGSANTADFTRVFTKSTTCDILIVGGGGSGDRQIGGGGGGGAVLHATNISIPANTYTIKVGKGGSNGNGGNSEAFGATCLGGGSTAFVAWGTANNGTAGGSGSGASPGGSTVTGGTVGTSTKGTLLSSGTLYNGNIGGNALPQPSGAYNTGGGGGGGAGTAGFNSSQTAYTTRSSWISAGRPYNGGDGIPINITGTTYYWGAGGGGCGHLTHAGDGGLGGGGGGGANSGSIAGLAGTDGINSGGNGINTGIESGGNGAPNTGSGGGGGGYNNQSTTNNGGNGGSGIVIIRYLLGTIPTNNLLTNEPTVSPSITSDIIIESYTYSGTANTMSYSKTFAINTVCDILIVAGGGGGGGSAGGGGGAGGLIYLTNQEILAGTYNITVGKGGGISQFSSPENGNNSSFGNFVAIGGGGGSSMDSTPGNGGSGGGGNRVPNAVASTAVAGQTGGTGTANQGNNGGTGKNNGGHDAAGGGGGGAGAAGDSAFAVGRGANGGIGRAIDITGTSVFYAGGGGGGSGSNFSTAGSGGSGGGGNGAIWSNTGSNGTDGLGGGGGGGSAYPGNGRVGGSGGSGIVIIRYRSLAQPPVSINMNKTLNFNYYATLSPIIYTLNFPKTTVVTINNGGDKLLNGTYTLTLSSNISTLVPIQNQTLQDTKIASSNISLRYHLLNPAIDPIGAQWTYSSNNTNVYHMGSVGIGTTTPEYTLDVRGTIYSSLGGYTSSTLTKWSVLSDRRIKENIVKASYDKCLDNVKNIELYNFNFKDNCVNTNDRHQLGFIAQEVQQVYPKAVEVGKMIVNLEQQIDDLLTLNITQIDYTLYGAVKSLIEKIENIKIKMEHIKTTYDIP